MLQLPGDIDKESKAKKGIIKLMLLHIRGDINNNSLLITDINLATPSKGMQLVLNQPHAARAGQFADLVQMTLDLAKQQDYTTIQSLQVSIWMMSKVLATHMPQGNFATEKVTSLELEANLIEPSPFLPQKYASLVECKRINEVKATTENVMDFSDSHKMKGMTATACIGMMTSMTDFFSLCINMNMIITAICSSEMPQLILRQILLNFVAIVNNPDWVHWYKSVGEMPLLHLFSYSFLEQIFNCFADFATNFGNGNVKSENFPIAELNTKALVCAVTVMKTFCDHINLHQATMTPIRVMPGVVAAYMVFPWNNAQACEPKKDNKSITLADGAS
jgi:hypothetical protein